MTSRAPTASNAIPHQAALWLASLRCRNHWRGGLPRPPATVELVGRRHAGRDHREHFLCGNTSPDNVTHRELRKVCCAGFPCPQDKSRNISNQNSKRLDFPRMSGFRGMSGQVRNSCPLFTSHN